MKLKIIKWIGVASFLVYSMSLYAYEMGSRPSDLNNSNLLHVHFDFEKNHEKMTALALYCLDTENKLTEDLNNSHKICSTRTLDGINLDKFITEKASSSDVGNYVPLIEHVRWPDDPTRMLSNKRSISKFGTLIKGVPPEAYGSCKKRAKEGEFRITEDGLLCNSHYGKLQFLHAMAEKNGEPASKTRSRMEEWLKFSFMVATSRQELNDNYCTFWKQNQEYPNLSNIMYEPSFSENKWCEERGQWRKYVPFIHPFPAWNVGTSFNLVCKGPLVSDTCNFYSSDPSVIRLIALGSILHMIQDSYSNSHVNRGSSGPEAKVICNPIAGFNGYFDQDSNKHTISDKWPSFDSSCNGDGTIDPITASTLAIWHVYKKSPLSEFQKLIDNILGEPSMKDSVAGAGAGYEKD